MYTDKEDPELKDKTVLVLGCEGIPSNEVLVRLNLFGLKVVVVDSSENYYTASMTKFIKYDCKDGQEIQMHANNIEQRLQELQLKFDGCVFIDLYAPLAAEIRRKLKLPGLPLKAIKGSMKCHTHNLLRARKQKNAGKVFLFDSIDEIHTALEYVGLPAVLKTEFRSTIFTRIVKDEATAVSLYKQISGNKEMFFQAYRRTVEDKKLILMEYFGGTEHGVDIIIFEGRLIAAFVHDKGAPDKEDFKPSTKVMPSILSKDQVDKLTEASYQCCIAIGLQTGVFNVDIKFTALGPRLIEINPRMGGNVIPEMIKTCYNVDLLKCFMLTTIGFKPSIANMDPKCYIAAMMCHESFHGRKLKDETTKTAMERLLNSGNIQYQNNQLPTEDIHDEHHYRPISAILVNGNSHQQAIVRLNNVCDELDLLKYDEDFNYYLTNCCFIE